MAAEPRTVLSLDAARLAREEEARLRASERILVVALTISAVAIVPPGTNIDAPFAGEPETLILPAADLVSDPGRLGEIARAMVARSEAVKREITTTERTDYGSL